MSHTPRAKAAGNQKYKSRRDGTPMPFTGKTQAARCCKNTFLPKPPHLHSGQITYETCWKKVTGLGVGLLRVERLVGKELLP